MSTLVTVLRSGGRYDGTWVARLAAGARRFTTVERIVCLTDCEVPSGVERIALRHGWPTWWAKFEAFRPGLFDGTVVLCDLDTVFAARADALFAEDTFTTLEDFFHKNRVSSALMRWNGNRLAFLYETFASDPEGFMRSGSCGPVPNAVHGDQVVIDHLLHREGLRPAFFQRKHPELIDFYEPTKRRYGPVVVFIGESKPDLAGEPIAGLWTGQTDVRP